MLTHEEICRAVGKAAPKYQIKNAYYFGSYARGTQTEDSDLDMLVDFGTPFVSLFYIAGLACDLEEMLSRGVDVIRLPLSPGTHLHIEKVVKCYGNTRPEAFSENA
ncbi:MAG: nucleotidyltransferase domain-containing protein [Clostridiales Family XIII bacterium]|jgi:predicted nucleotidyltransferase|nr:nucleotidyltransferase domain-containing protein [Clostridiales Family XIII bacterium]